MSQQLQARRAKPDDKETVIAIARAFDPNDWLPYEYDAFMEADPNLSVLYVAEQDGRVVGCAHLSQPWQGDSYLSALRMDPAVQGRGLATRFVGDLIDQVRRAGLGSLYLLSEVNNLPAHRVFYKNGFVNIGEWLVYGELPLVKPGAPSECARKATEEDLSWIKPLCPADSLAGVISAHYHPYVVRGLREEDWQLGQLYVLEGEGFLLVREIDDALMIRKLEGSPEAAAELLALAAAHTEKSAWAVSLPARCEHLLASIHPPLKTAFRPYVFLRHPGA